MGLLVILFPIKLFDRLPKLYIQIFLVVFKFAVLCLTLFVILFTFKSKKYVALLSEKYEKTIELLHEENQNLQKKIEQLE